MIIFIEGVSSDIWKVMKNDPFFPTHQVNGVTVKNEYDLTKEEKEIIQHNLKVKTIIITALYLDEFLRVSHCKIEKDIWSNLQVTHEGICEVKKLE